MSTFEEVLGPQSDEIRAALKKTHWDHEAKIMEADAAYQAAKADGLHEDLAKMYLDEDRRMILEYLAESDSPECVGLALYLLDDDEDEGPF